MTDPLARKLNVPNSQEQQPQKVNKAKEFERQLQEQEKQIVSQSNQFQQSSNPTSVITFPQQQQTVLGQILDAPRKLFFKTAQTQQGESQAPQFTTPPREIGQLGLYGIQPGEQAIKEARTHCLSHMTSYEGIIVLTNYQIAFIPDKRANVNVIRKDFYYIPLALIFKVERTIDKKNNDTSYIDISSKDGRFFRFRFSREQLDESYNLHDCILRTAFITNKQHYFAIQFYKEQCQLELAYTGWKIYNIVREFERQQIFIMDENSKQQGLFKYYKNEDLCMTYHNILVVPSKADQDQINKTAKFRSKERIPILSYAYQSDTKTISLWRSSQTRGGINNYNRSNEDEFYLKNMCVQSLDEYEQNDDREVRLRIYDARPQINAIGQGVAGKGYENISYYRKCSIDFLDIHNIHKVRDSYVKIQKASLAEPNQFLSQLELSGWYDHIVTIIQGSIKIAKSLTIEKINCLVHCSDGWDRTSQLISLAQMMIDPYFRTIEGLIVLIQKEWVYAGHQFCQRSGVGSKQQNDDQRAPIFLQFLDCIFQLMQCYPLSFEFNNKLLYDLAYHHQSGLFGTFLCDSYKELAKMKIIDETVSIWSWILSQKALYINQLYRPQVLKGYLIPENYTGRSIVFWKEYFLYFHIESLDRYNRHNYTEENTQEYLSDIKKDHQCLKQFQSEVENLSAMQQQYIKQLQTIILESKNEELIGKFNQIVLN